MTYIGSLGVFNIMWPFTKKAQTLDEYGRSDLHYSARDADLAAVKRLMASGADVNLQDKKGWTPLHFAAQARSEEVAAYLLAHGASVDLEDVYGNTASLDGNVRFARRGWCDSSVASRWSRPKKKEQEWGQCALACADNCKL